MLSQLLLFKLFNRLNLRKLKGLAYEHLENGLSLQFKVEEVVVAVVDLDVLAVSLWVWYEDRRWLNRYHFSKRLTGLSM